MYVFVRGVTCSTIWLGVRVSWLRRRSCWVCSMLPVSAWAISIFMIVNMNIWMLITHQLFIVAAVTVTSGRVPFLFVCFQFFAFFLLSNFSVPCGWLRWFLAAFERTLNKFTCCNSSQSDQNLRGPHVSRRNPGFGCRFVCLFTNILRFVRRLSYVDSHWRRAKISPVNIVS